MPIEFNDVRKQFERGVVILSLDTEQIWGYLDLFNERQFRRQYPNALEAHTKLLALLAEAGVSATWFVVGGMTLDRSAGPRDRRMAGLPSEWTAKIPAGVATTRPLWYRPSFVEHLRRARPLQEIGLHGGLTHFIWTDPRATREVVEWELAEGVAALEQVFVRPLSFSFGREQEAYHELLPAHGIRCYRGRTVARSLKLGPRLLGALARLFDELRRSTPLPVWPQEILPGLWSIPSSLFLYPIRASRTRVVGLRSRIERFSRGVAAATRYRGIFHFCLHPENLTESRDGFSMFEEMLERLILSRDRGDVEILTMSEVAARMERWRGRERPASVHTTLSEAPIKCAPGARNAIAILSQGGGAESISQGALWEQTRKAHL
jgi:peptidoglycan/xylan/chitin deacetylase (PgdA/CDA1 family)